MTGAGNTMVSFADLTSACPALGRLLSDARDLHWKERKNYCRSSTWAVVEKAIVALVEDGKRRGDPALSSPGALVVLSWRIPICESSS
jgi:hypothetical protein